MNFPNIKIPNSFVLTTGVKSDKPKKFKLYKVVVPLALVGGISIAVVSGITKKNASQKNYYDAKYNNKTFEQTVDGNPVSYLISDTEMAEYEKFKEMLKCKKLFDQQNLEKYESHYVNYDDITVDYCYKLLEKYYDLHNDGGPEYTEVCQNMKSISKAIEKYNDEKGKEIVEDMAIKVMISKATDSSNLDINKVDNVSLKYCNRNLLKVKFDYWDNGEKTTYISDKFKNQGDDYVENLGRDLKRDSLEAIYDINALTSDENYEIGIKVK